MALVFAATLTSPLASHICVALARGAHTLKRDESRRSGSAAGVTGALTGVAFVLSMALVPFGLRYTTIPATCHHATSPCHVPMPRVTSIRLR